MNLNSDKGKPAEIANILDYTKPDVVVMSETKLGKSCYWYIWVFAQELYSISKG